ncbi:MAG TPA: crosslink repair DNA glycosylase YcaQ family protein [Candidatus Saccharimonadaceae bacterium]|nr:crosslink repair DNA glycosylase YcaQ family protein [Candidatus Saccharimonadaceae bacterium]
MDLRHVRRVFGRIQLIQIDSVNVFVRAHYVPLFARLGRYDPGLLDRMAYERRELFEYWGHEASFLPVELWPLMRWQMERALRGELWGGMVRFAKENAGYIEAVYEEVRARGPLSVADLSDKGERGGPWWGWAPGKTALEWLFWTGRITTSSRRNFARVYDLVERVIPSQHLNAPIPDQHEQHRRLLVRAARALGVATANDLADYFRIKKPDARPRVTELAEEGLLVPVRVEGWKQEAYLDPKAPKPRAVDARALVSPFDSLVWERSRAERLFGFRYRIEIYTPAHKRVHGYYVVPFLLGEHLAARVDLKADRRAGTLLVHAAYSEDHADPKQTAGPLREQLNETAEWLGLDRVKIGARGNLARALRASR